MNPNLMKLFSQARSVLICISKNARIDGIASGLAISIAAVSQGKTVFICSEAQTSEAKNLVGIDKVSKNLQLGGNILKVSFPYQEGAIDKVTYNITDDKFNLLVEPRAGQLPLASDNVQFSYTGGAADVIVTVDSPNLESLGNIYLDNPDIFVQEKIVNIDRRFDNKNYGAENLVDKQSSSTSEIVLRLIQGLRWDLNTDIATDLYAGLSAATNNFTSFSTNAQSFEAASLLLKSGARKIPVAAARPQQPYPQANPFGGFSPNMPVDDPFFDDGTMMSPNPFIPPQPQTSTPVQQVQPNQSPVNVPQQSQNQQAVQGSDKTPPQDWLKPKIFKSTDLV
ncbi:MAG: hypothetical protein WC775_03320 [Patescibacteria group bacterium]|jgi:hypothetical protein